MKRKLYQLSGLFLWAVLMVMSSESVAQQCSIAPGFNPWNARYVNGTTSQTFTACGSGRINGIRLTNRNAGNYRISLLNEAGTVLLGRTAYTASAANADVNFSLLDLGVDVTAGTVYRFMIDGSMDVRISNGAANFYTGGTIVGGGLNDDIDFAISIRTITEPTVNPIHNASQVDLINPIQLQFAEAMKIGTGNITLENVTNASNTVISVNDLIIDNSLVTIPVSQALDTNALYRVIIPFGAIKTVAVGDGIKYRGKLSGEWNFTTGNKPAVALSASFSITNQSTFTVSVDFSTEVSGLALADIEVSNANLSNLTGAGSAYTFDVSPIADGLVGLMLLDSAVEDGNGNPNAASQVLNIDYDIEFNAPELMAPVGITKASPFIVQYVFDEAIVDFESSDFAVTNGSVTGIELDGNTLNVEISAAAPGIVSVNLLEDSIQDLAGNTNTLITYQTEYQLSIDEGLIAYYPLNGSLIDATGKNNTAVAYSGAPSVTTDRFGQASSAYSYVNSASRVPAFNNIPDTDGFSASVWVKPVSDMNQASPRRVIYDHRGTTSILYYQAGQVRFDLNNPVVTFTYDTTFFANQWVYLAVSVKESGAVIFHIGTKEVQVGTAPAALDVRAQDLLIGGSYEPSIQSAAYFANAVIDELRFYSRAIGSLDADSLYSVPQLVPAAISKGICLGDELTLPDGRILSTAGKYFYVEPAQNALDTLVVLNLTVNALPAVTANASYTTICQNSEVTLTGGGAINYSWNDGITNGIPFMPSATATYTVLGTDANGCVNTAEIEVVVNANSLIDQSLSLEQSVFCSDTSVAVTLGGSQQGYDYYLRRDNDNSIVDGPIAGTGDTLEFTTDNIIATAAFNVYAVTQGSNSTGLDFDGINDKVEIPFVSPLVGTSTFTLEAWINPTKTSTGRIISRFSGAANTAGDVVFDTNGPTNNGRGLRVYMVRSNLTAFNLSVDNVLSMNTWNHVAATFSAGTVTLYVNGVQVTSGAFGEASIVSASGSWVLGEDRGGTVLEHFGGKMDEVRFWNVARTAQDIQSTMNTCLVGDEAGLTAYYKFDDGTGATTLNDNSINANNGNLLNMDAANDWTSGAIRCVVACEIEMSDKVFVTIDGVAPTAIGQDISVQLDNSGQLAISPEQINNGSIDNCTATENLIMELSKSSFNCDEIGQHEVLLTVTDEKGYSSTDTVMVTINSFVESVSLSASSNDLCPGESVEISTSSSKSGVTYYLVNADDSTTVDGPLNGTGDTLRFTTGALLQTQAFQIKAEQVGIGENVNALTFDGINDFVNVGTSNRGVLGLVTVSAWVKTTQNPAAPVYIVSKYDATRGYLLGMNQQGKVFFDGREGSGSYRSSGISNISINDGEWHYITGFLNVFGWGIYVDGVLQSFNSVNVPSTNLTNTFPLTIGSLSGTSAFFNGLIDQVSIWNRDLTENEINQAKNSCNPTSNGLVAHFQFTEGSGTTATDLSASAINATLGNMAASAWTTIVSPSCPINGCSIFASEPIVINILVDTIAPSINVPVDINIQLDASGNASISADLIIDNISDNCTSAQALMYSLSQMSFTCDDLGIIPVMLTIEDLSGNTDSLELSVTVQSYIEEVIFAETTIEVCAGNSADIVLQNTQADVNYYLRDEANNIIGNAYAGNGADVTITTPEISQNTNFNIYAQVQSNSINAGLSFDGINDKVEIPYNSTQNYITNGQLTIELWVYPTKESLSRLFTSFNGVNAVAGSLLLDTYGTGSNVDGRDLRYYYQTPNGSQVLAFDNVLTLNEWNHVAISYNNAAGGLMSLYHNGQLLGTRTTFWNIQSPPVNFVLGEDYGGSISEHFEGKMDEFRFWTSVRSQAEIQASMNQCLGGNENNLKVYYNFDAGSGTTVNDVTTNNNDGNLLNFDPVNAWSAGRLRCDDIATCGLAMTQTVSISVDDNQIPAVSVNTFMAELLANGQVVVSPLSLENGSTDNCTKFEDLTFEIDRTDFSCEDIGDNTVNFTVTDLAGNESTVEAIVTVVDKIAPTVITRNITLTLDQDNTPITIVAADLDSATFDNCLFDLAISQTTFGSEHSGQNEVVLTATDSSGNIGTALAMVTVIASGDPQTLTFNALESKTYGNTPFQIMATASSGLGVAFSSSNLDVATVAGDMVTIVGAGDAVITAFQAGDDVFRAALATQTLTVAKALINVSADDKIITYGDDLPEFTITYSGFVNDEDANILDTAPQAHLVEDGALVPGIYEIALLTGSDNNYDFTYGNGQLTINRVGQVISVEPIADKIITDPAFEVTASVSSDLELSYQILSGPATINGNTITLNGTEGLVTVEVSQAGNQFYNVASITTNFNVIDTTKTPQTITIQPIVNKFVTSPAFNVEASTTSGLELTYSVSGPASISGNTVTLNGTIGTVTITVSQAGNSEFSPASTSVSFDVLPDPCIGFEISLLNSGSVGCHGGADGFITIQVISGTAPYNYSWSHNANLNNTTAANLSAGVYTVTATDANNCTVSASFEVIQPQSALLPFVSQLTDVSCFGAADGAIDLAILGGTAPYNYAWSTGATSEDINELVAGNYQVTVTDANNCPAQLNVSVAQPQELTVSGLITQTDFFNNTGSIDVMVTGGTAPYNYFWSNEAGSEDLTGLGAGVYTVNVSDARDCSAQMTFEITVDLVSGLDDVLNNNSFRLYPNPAEGFVSLKLELSSAKEIRLELVNTLGETVWSKELGQVVSIDENVTLHNHNKGMYILRIVSESGIRNEKLVVR